MRFMGLWVYEVYEVEENVSQRKATARRHERQNRRRGRIARWFVGNLAYVFLGGAIVLFAVAAIAAAQRIPGGTAEGANDAASAAATANAGTGWIPLTAQSPRAIIEAARKSSLFHVNRTNGGDYLRDLSRLETPVYVRALHVAGSVTLPDYYVIPIDDASGRMVGAAELALNPAHTAVQLTAIITYKTPRPHGQLTLATRAAAVTDVARQRHTTLRHNAQPELVYVPIDATALQTGAITWNGGGEYPADPVWVIPGADGADHIVGTDGHVYAPGDLPVMKQP